MATTERAEDGPVQRCEAPDCTRTMPYHAWGRIRGAGFQAASGRWWCRDHLPSWVTDWRDRYGSRR